MKLLNNESERTELIFNFFKTNPKPISTGKILDIENDIAEKYEVYEMPACFFVHNPNNGRHFAELQEWIMQKGIKNDLDPVKDNEILEKLLKESSLQNGVTKQNLKDYGQQEPIIATKNGIIIDGNRRFMLLKTIWRERKENLFDKTIAVIVLKKNYTKDELNEIETKIQFRKEGKVDYDPINKKIKIFNMYKAFFPKKELVISTDIINAKFNTDVVKKISQNTGESANFINKSLEIINFINWFINKNNLNQETISLFLKKDEQLKNLFSAIRRINDEKIKLDNKEWFIEDKNIIEKLINISIYHILGNVKAVGSFRDLMPNKNNLAILKYQELFNEWYNQTLKLLDLNNLNNIFLFNNEIKIKLEQKRNDLETLNKSLLHEIYILNEQIKKQVINEIGEFDINKSESENAISFFHRRLSYFKNIKKINDINNLDQLLEISKAINNLLNN